MKRLHVFFTILSVLFLYNCSSSSDDIDTTDDIIIIDEETALYFPPLNSTEWETLLPSELEWNTTALDDLYTYLDEKNTKGFIILKDGKIVVERYFNGHNQNTNWAWFSAVKSLTATAVGVAQDEGFLNINNKTSDYLGNNWSSLTQEQQDLITVRHHLTMSTGLENNQANVLAWTCTQPFCMIYNFDAGTTWQYHQGAFTQLQIMLSQNTGIDYKVYIKEKILDRIGTSGSWNSFLGANIFSSNTRGMARFGLLSLNKGTWEDDIIVNASYFEDMTNTSQNMNKSYGYLWWLNGKDSFLVPESQDLFDGPLVPNAPSNMFAALGANDQKIYVIPSQNLVVIRSGESAGNEQLANSSFDNELWGKINLVIE